MSVNKVNSDGSLSRVAGGTLYADLPIGAVIPFGGSVVPSGYLLCNGAEVLKTAYAELYAVIGDAFGTASDNTKFKLPDLREAVPKGAGLSGKSSVHYDSDGVALGEFIEDRVQTHTHGIYYSAVAPSGGNSGVLAVSGNIIDTAENSGRKGDTTEVKAVGANYIIKAKQVAAPADFMDAIDDEVKTLLATPTRYLVPDTLPTTAKVDNTHNHLIHLKIKLKNYIPSGYKLYKATLDIAWPNGNSYEAYMNEVMSTRIELTTTGEDKEVEFTLITKNAQTLGADYTTINTYYCTIECVKE